MKKPANHERTARKEPMNKEARSRIESLFQAMQGRMEYLYGRWQDEKEYEDFAGYVENIRSLITEHDPGVELERMKKRPFAVLLRVSEWDVTVSISSRKYSWSARKAI